MTRPLATVERSETFIEPTHASITRPETSRRPPNTRGTRRETTGEQPQRRGGESAPRARRPRVILPPGDTPLEKERTGYRRAIELAQALKRPNTSAATLETILEWAILEVQAEQGYIVVPTNKDPFAIHVSRTPDRQPIPEGARAVSATLLRHALDMGETLAAQYPWDRLEGTKGDYKLRYATGTLKNVARSVIVAPLSEKKGRSLGVLVLHERNRAKPFSRHDLRQVEPVAGFAASILEEGAPPEPLPDRHGLIGSSKAFSSFMEKAEKAARSHQTVLIQGESGSGKEKVASLMHNLSPRATGPFIVANSSCFTEALVESLLFGHVKGAFTGADRDSDGLFLEARGGTIFLDEIGEASAPLQAKLLRVLQERTFRPVGGKQDLKTDVRIVAATNRDLATLVKKGEFRADLYYRLAVLKLTVPPLRERRDDLEALAHHFIEKVAREEGRPVKDLGPGCVEALAAHDWPGNVRELENLIRAAFVLGHDPIAPIDFEIPRMSVVARDLDREYSARLQEYVEAAHAVEEARAAGSKEPWRLLDISKATFHRRVRWGEEQGLTLDAAVEQLKPSP